jgi:protein TonB
MKSFLLIIFLIIGFISNAQESPKTTIENIKDSTIFDYDAVIKYVDEDAEYPGGLVAMMKFIQENLVYPDYNSIDISEFGRIRVYFTVEKDGSLSEIEVLNKNPKIKKLHEDVFAKMPPWKPAKLNGIVVRQRFFIPVHFCF